MPIAETLLVAVIIEPLNSMAHDMSFGEDQSWYVGGKKQITAVQGIAQVDLITRHDWANESIGVEASHQAN